jgi:hypothetical protein
MLPPFTWHIFQIIVDYLSLIVNAYALTQFWGHLLLYDMLHELQ